MLHEGYIKAHYIWIFYICVLMQDPPLNYVKEPLEYAKRGLEHAKVEKKKPMWKESCCKPLSHIYKDTYQALEDTYITYTGGDTAYVQETCCKPLSRSAAFRALLALLVRGIWRFSCFTG